MRVMDVFEAWAAALGAPETADMPGVAFLRMWLRRSTLEPIITRELGQGALYGDWMEDGRAQLKAYPCRRGRPLACRQHRDPAASLDDLCACWAATPAWCAFPADFAT